MSQPVTSLPVAVPAVTPAAPSGVAREGLLSVRSGLEAERRTLLDRLGDVNRDISRVTDAINLLADGTAR